MCYHKAFLINSHIIGRISVLVFVVLTKKKKTPFNYTKMFYRNYVYIISRDLYYPQRETSGGEHG